ncbi:sigma-54-dependent Fis family transcriptional regulator [Geovibrio thiophilus]|uniref:Sigma-54-dependent Fis family transcriptional regulator n=1 Tax=Geovibrio thiophilus TaxID=139438 RepID=A0A410JX32_9BACT|nr:sigma-54 dependent transcriptional regulator [Geovibrio thiophilus]QAR32639.1 sigma-54-dependent Fis family transcriptional regulator [Geovibrio thiophilus]
MKKILIIDDDTSLCYGMKRVLSGRYSVSTVSSSEEAFEHLGNGSFSLILLDYRLGSENGLEVLEKIKELSRTVPVVMLTAFGTSDTVLDSFKLGAADFLVKPVDYEELTDCIEKYARPEKISCGEDALPVEELGETGSAFVGSSRKIRDVFKLIATVANSNTPVFITGESGTGKELIAGLVHERSHRRDKPFVVINCAAIPRELLESELFGYVKGAFTGAHQDRTGKFEAAHTGTLFLDEIGELPVELQSKMLRVLQNGTIERLGSNKSVHVDVRIVSATNRNIAELIAAGEFRSDLFYRLNVVDIKLPPLRERTDDIPPLAAFFAAKYSLEAGKSICCIDREVVDIFRAYSWPGNIREMQNVIKKAVILSSSNRITESDIQLAGQEAEKPESSSAAVWEYFFAKFPSDTLNSSVEELEKILIEKSLLKNSNHLTHTAEELGITRVTLNAKMKKYGINI